MFQRAVRHTSDLVRIQNLPRRQLSRERAVEIAAELTPRYAKRAGCELKPWQGFGLYEVPQVGGGVLALPVGIGKTLLCETLPLAMKARKSGLVLPAALKEKTFGDRRRYAEQWRTANPPPRIITREELALEQNAYLLESLDLDLILIDEAHKMRNADASAWKRIERFVRNKRAKGKAAGLPWPHGVAVVALTGTLSRRSIMGYWHILVLALGDAAPVPLAKADAELWAEAIDDASPRAGFRPDPGALGATIEQAREWYSDRLTSTPGVIVVDEDSAGDVPLSIAVELAPDCDVIDEAFVTLRTLWESPSGEPISDPLSLMRVEGQTGSGFVTYWDPPPPQRWVAARRALAKFIRERIAATQNARKPLDTDAQVIKAHPDHPAVVEWKAIGKSFDPLKHSRVRWISDTTFDWAKEWLLADTDPTVLWCGNVEFADRLSRETRIPYYGPKGREVRTGANLHDADVKRTPRMICSWHACREGQNLQHWRRQGIIQAPQSAEALEQIFGRPHRQGQTDAVRFTILATSGGSLDAFAAAISEAEFVRESGRQTQKILRATIEPLPCPPLTLRWQTRD